HHPLHWPMVVGDVSAPRKIVCDPPRTISEPADIEYMTTVVVAERDPEPRELVRSALAARGYTVLTARDRAELIALVDQQEVDLVVSTAELAGVATAPLMPRATPPPTEIVLADGTPNDVARAAACVEAG